MAVIIYLKDILQKSSFKASKSSTTTKTRITKRASTLCASLVKRKPKTKEEVK